MAKKKKQRPPVPGAQVISTNRRARHDYEITSTYEAGLVLRGTEVKSLRDGRVTLGEGFIVIKDGEAWLMGVHIPEYTHGNRFNHEPRRPRKLLLRSLEIERIARKLEEQGYTGVPMVLYFKGGWVKLEFGLGKGKKHYDKRQAERQKIDHREMREDRY